MDCVRETALSDPTCGCPQTPETYNLNLSLVHVPEDDLAHDQSFHKRHIRRKRRCRTQTGELCNFVRLLPETFPGIMLEIPEYFECIPNVSCETVIDKDAEGPGQDYISERCTNEKGKVKTGQGALLLPPKGMIWIMVLLTRVLKFLLYD